MSEACAWLGIARATYYRWKTAWESKCPDPMVVKVVQLCTQH
ncbi:helix-turn-helix domain-containing protein [Paenibacillus sp. UASWS1643]|nr:helix-turn-helix domain-containing protein [Paenibacillus sp. UASWS1643]